MMNRHNTIPATARGQIWVEGLRQGGVRAQNTPPCVVEGRLTRMVGLTLEAVGCQVPVGSRCDVLTASGEQIEAEVVGFAGEHTYLMPTGHVAGLTPNARVVPSAHSSDVAIGEAMLGRVIDASGRPLDGKGPIETHALVPLMGRPINPLNRQPIARPHRRRGSLPTILRNEGHIDA